MSQLSSVVVLTSTGPFDSACASKWLCPQPRNASPAAGIQRRASARLSSSASLTWTSSSGSLQTQAAEPGCQ
jgi:hypothetical protein